MPSQLHEALVELFRNSPELGPTLLKGLLGDGLPAYSRVEMPSSDLSDVRPVEYRADAVAVLYDVKPVFVAVLEVQLRVDLAKLISWPAYCAVSRSRYGCPAAVLVITPHESVARWAAKPIDLGAGNFFTPLVIGPSGIPYVTDEEVARQAPELAVLSAMAHGQDADFDRVSQVALAALAASVDLDEGRSILYCDLIRSSLSEAAKKALGAMDLAKYEFQSEFAKHYISVGVEQGVSEGAVQGQAELVIEQLCEPFGPLSDEVTLRIRESSSEQLRAMAKRIRNAETLEDVLGE